MGIEITPEPTPEERAAVEQALAALRVAAISGRGAWWEEGILENALEEDEAGHASRARLDR